MKSYYEMLDEAYEKLLERTPTKSFRDKLEIPLPKVSYQKGWTVILNAKEFSQIFNRDLQLIAKFLQIEYNAPTRIENNTIIIMRKVTMEGIREKMKRFAKEFVVCPVCGKPDTSLVKRNRILYLKCMACGAESPILYKIK